MYEVQKSLEKDTYTKFHPARHYFKRVLAITPRTDAQWQGNLAEMGNFAR
jgi:hypothetical protein